MMPRIDVLPCMCVAHGRAPGLMMLSHPTWEFLLTPTLCGAALIIVIALVVNNLGAIRRYPAYWFGRSSERDAK